MIRVTAPSRLHFGLFRLPTERYSYWPDLDGNATVPVRNFGGIGLMIDQPGVQISVAPATTWSATGPMAERALNHAQQFLLNSPELGPQAFTLTVERCAPEHMGLGTGTQLGLAVAKAVAVALGQPEWEAAFLAQRLGRGQRSGIGIHGFQQGGFLVDGGKGADTAIAPLVARCAFPKDWAVLLVLPRSGQGLHGSRERAAFAHLAQTASTPKADTLCRLVLLGMLPALAEHDLDAFGANLYEFNRRVGEMFRPWQGGLYVNPKTAAIVEFIATRAIRGVGQSSWGPAVFAVHSLDEVKQLVEPLRNQFGLSQDEVVLSLPANRGANVTT